MIVIDKITWDFFNEGEWQEVNSKCHQSFYGKIFDDVGSMVNSVKEPTNTDDLKRVEPGGDGVVNLYFDGKGVDEMVLKVHCASLIRAVCTKHRITQEIK